MNCTTLLKCAAAAMLLLATACKKEQPQNAAATLSLDKGTTPIEFSAEATETFIYEVTTNQDKWNAVSNQEWCKVTKSSTSFILTATPNTTTTPRPEALVTVTAGKASALAIKVTQKAVGPMVSVSPAPENDEIIFPVEGKVNIYTVSTNQETWDVESNKDWCKVEKGADGNGFTLTAPANNSSIAREDATITIKAGDAQTLVFTAKQAGLTVSEFGDDIAAAESYGAGEGTAEKPYLITSAAELKKLFSESDADTKGKYYQLDVDIKVTAANWIALKFQGNFDGNGHTVTGKLIGNNDSSHGFFGWMLGDAVVSNLTVDAEVESTAKTGNIYTGAIAGGMTDNVKIIGCKAKGSVKSSTVIETSNKYCFTGGILGCSKSVNNRIEDCVNSADVFGGVGTSSGNHSCNTGGVVGDVVGTITGCTNNGNVKGGSMTSSDENVTLNSATGGVVGYLSANSNMHLSTNTGDVTKGVGTSVLTGGISASIGNNAFIYSCNTNTGKVDGADASDENRLGEGSITDCTEEGHIK